MPAFATKQHDNLRSANYRRAHLNKILSDYVRVSSLESLHNELRSRFGQSAAAQILLRKLRPPLKVTRRKMSVYTDGVYIHWGVGSRL